MALTLDVLDRLDPPAEYRDLERYAPYLLPLMEQYMIDTPARICAFIAQVSVESNHFKTVQENLNYGAQGLANTWAKFSITGARGGPPNALALRIARNPVEIANHAYANRYGNGGPETNDGWRYSGKGLKQVTFRDNYAAYSQWAGVDAVNEPSLLLMPEHACKSAIWYWDSRNLNFLADYDDEEHFHQISYKINGGWNGKLARLECWQVARSAYA